VSICLKIIFSAAIILVLSFVVIQLTPEPVSSKVKAIQVIPFLLSLSVIIITLIVSIWI